MTARKSLDDASTSVKSNPQFDPVFRSPIKPQETEQEEPTIVMTEKAKEPEAVKAVIKESVPSIPTTNAKSSTPNHTRGRPMTETESEKTAEKTSNERPSVTKEKVKEVIPEIARSASTSENKSMLSSSGPTPFQASASTEMNKSLASVLSQFMENQNAIVQAKGTGIMPTGNPAEVVSHLNYMGG
jgi:4-diphosphocytidyl-2C-methyl-D-erythritol kinase